MTALMKFPKYAIVDDLAGAVFFCGAGVILLILGGFAVDDFSLPYKSAPGVVLRHYIDPDYSEVWVKTPDGVGVMDTKQGYWMWDADGQQVQVIYSVGRLSHEVRPQVILPRER